MILAHHEAPMLGTARGKRPAPGCEAPPAPLAAALALAGAGLVTGMPLPELAHRLDHAANRFTGPGQDAAELAARAQLMRVLLHGGGGAAEAKSSAERFGHWLALLQAACYADALPQALDAAARLDRLACPATPADRLCHHLFAALALAQAADAASARPLDLHCAALRRLARALPDAEAMRVLADAVRAGREDNRLAALRGCEDAAAMATERERHWLAALAWEAAARQAATAGLESAVRHYRRCALASYGYWGALGRIDTLQRRWQDPDLDGRSARAADQLRGCGAELGLSIAHEVNQPLAAIALHAAAARKWLRRPEPDIERALSSIALIGDAGRHAGDIVRGMQRLATRAGNERAPVALDQAIGAALQPLQPRLRKHGIQVEFALEPGRATIHASPTQLQQVLTNLLVNAIEALGGDGVPAHGRHIRIASYRAGAQEVEIAIADNGPGIAPQLRERVFGSLFSTKPHGTGMGLAISLAIVRAHGGHLGFTPAEPHGACFRLRLPLAPPLDAA